MTDPFGAGAFSARHFSNPAPSANALEAGADRILFGNQATPGASLRGAGEISTAVVAAVTSGALARSALVNAAAHVVVARDTVARPGVPSTSTTLQIVRRHLVGVPAQTANLLLQPVDFFTQGANLFFEFFTRRFLTGHVNRFPYWDLP
jgi:hypothetical protein